MPIFGNLTYSDDCRTYESDFVKRRISILLLLCWLCANVLAASPAFHELLHGANAGHGEHECVVTLLATGGLDSPTIATFCVNAPMMVECSALRVGDADIPAIFLGGGLSDRGPPMAGA